MPINNLNNTHLTTPQITAINAALTALDAALSSLDSRLTPEERKQYGSINEQSKLLVNKVKDYHDSQPALSDATLNWTEFYADYSSRMYKEGVINRLLSMITRLTNSKILHDYDNYQAALQEYACTAYMASRGNPDYEIKHSELKQFFNRSGSTKTVKNED